MITTEEQFATPRSVVTSYLESFSSGDPDLIAAHVSIDFVNEHTAALGDGCVGQATYRERLPGFLGDMVGLVYEIEDLVVEGNTVAAFTTLRAVWQSATPVVIRGVQRLVVNEGKIVHRTDYWDSQVFLRQISDD